MNTPIELIGLFGFVISILLSMVVYFVRLLHVDFRRMQKDISEMKATTSVIKSEFKSGLTLIGQRVEQLEERIKRVEGTMFRVHGGSA
jgi:hypothetical protein